MHVLLVGYEPEAVDFSDPALTPGLDAQKIHAGIAIAMQDMLDRGWTADHCFIRPDGQAAAAVSRQLERVTDLAPACAEPIFAAR